MFNVSVRKIVVSAICHRSPRRPLFRRLLRGLGQADHSWDKAPAHSRQARPRSWDKTRSSRTRTDHGGWQDSSWTTQSGSNHALPLRRGVLARGRRQ